jgi:hypothetical protein
MFGVHPELRGKVVVTCVSSAAVVLFGLFAVLGAWGEPYAPWLMILLFATAALCIAWAGLVIAPRWYRHASRVVASTLPAPATIVLQLESDSESTALYASFATSPPMANAKIERFPLVIPSWSIESYLGAPLDATVYRDPSTQHPVAFQIAGGLLWCMPYARAWRV